MAKMPTLIVLPVLVGAACMSGRAEPGTPTGPDAAQQSSSPALDLTSVADNALETMPTTPVAPRFVLEHRSALNGKTITVEGTVIRTVPGPSSGGGGSTPSPGANPQPRVFLVETPVRQDDPYQLMVLLREGDGGFAVGQRVEITGVVESGPGAVLLRREYD